MNRYIKSSFALLSLPILPIPSSFQKQRIFSETHKHTYMHMNIAFMCISANTFSVFKYPYINIHSFFTSTLDGSGGFKNIDGWLMNLIFITFRK